MSQTTGLPLLQCWQCKISIKLINWWLNKDNILFPKRPPRLWSWSFSTAIFIRPQLAEKTVPPAGPVALVAWPTPLSEKKYTSGFLTLLFYWSFLTTLMSDNHSDTTTCLFQPKSDWLRDEKTSHVGPGSLVGRPSLTYVKGVAGRWHYVSFFAFKSCLICFWCNMIYLWLQQTTAIAHRTVGWLTLRAAREKRARGE